ncbi:DNA topoisomerase [Salix suchowensis]|nr:DNA topoisomerase [Salix suchowensis]
MTEEDEWVHVAFNDDTLVVELLLNLSQPEQPPPPPRRRRRRRFAGDLAKEGAVLALSVDWSVRQRRSSSRQVMMTKSKKGSDSSSSRASPTTPLSFSGGTSVSGGGGGAGDGFDEATTSASLPAKLIATSRSKVAVTRETPAIKRSRKKKKLVDLREEEILLLKEKRHLKNKLATFQASLEEERVRNERLKRMKFDLLSQHRPEVFTAAVNSEIISIQPRDTKVACDSTYSIVPHNVSFQLQEGEDRKSSFILPDLNLPVEGDSSSGILV